MVGTHMDNSIRLIVGLGNPDARYERTRHNIGREFVDFLAESRKLDYNKSKGCDVIRLNDWEGTSLSHSVTCARLPSFMNTSGPVLKDLALKENAAPHQILIVLDDFMIPFGTLRLRGKGSSGGHNGLKSIFEAFGSEEIPRLRFGIGPVPPGEDPADFVLKRFSAAELKSLPTFFEGTRAGLLTLFDGGLEKAMNRLNAHVFLP